MGRRVFRNFEQWLEDIYHQLSLVRRLVELTPDDVFEVVHQSTAFEDLVQSGYLDKPSDIVRNEFMVDDPFSKFVPFSKVSVV